jgi:hypothetical protein
VRSKNAWTDEDNERLEAFVADGVSLVRAAVAFKRKLNSVRKQARKLGTPFPPLKESRKKYADSPSSSWRQY